MIFEVLALVGVLGIVLMTVTGFVHFGGHAGVHNLHQGGRHHGLFGHHGHSGGHAGRGALHGHGNAALPSHGAAPAHGQAPHAPVARTGSDSGAAQPTPTLASHVQYSSLLSFIPSPFDAFSLLTGAGLAGIIFQRLLPFNVLLIVVIFGALAFNYGLMRPLMGVFMNFASKPTEGLEGVIASTAEAITPFDKRGRGLVRVNLDGQIVQLLGYLSGDEVARGVLVGRGDQLVVTEVNPQASTCTVTRELTL
jgi:hypothetical protein